MTPWKYSWVTPLALLLAGTASAQSATKYISKQTFTAAQLATAQSLNPPGGTAYASFFPECSVGGKDSVCVRFDPGGSADSSASPPLGESMQFYLGESAGISATFQVILDASATGATGTTPTLTVLYYGR